MVYSDCIIYHGDFDGVVSAAFVVLGRGASEALLLPSEPFTVDRTLKKISAEGHFSRIFSADIAPNNRKSEMTRKFIHDCSALCDTFYLYDHHHGWENFKTPGNCELSVDVAAKSCAGFLFKAMWPKGGWPAGADVLAADADIVDSGGCDGISDDGGLIFRALKSNLRDESIREAALRYIVSGFFDLSAREFLMKRAVLYDEILKKSLELQARATEPSPGICYVDTDGEVCDMTAVIRECYKKYNIVIIEYATTGNSFYVIATRDPEINILEKLRIKSGSRYRVTVPKRDLRDIIAKLTS